MFILVPIVIMFLLGILGYKRPRPALIALPLVIAALLISSAALGFEEWYFTVGFLFSIAILFVTLSACSASKYQPDSDQLPQRIAKWILIILLMLAVLIATAVAFGPLSIYGFILFAVFVALVIGYYTTSRRMTAANIISTIGSSIRQNLPLPMALESASSGRGDVQSKTLGRIKKWLVEGYPLSEAIKRGWPKCPSRAMAMIAAAEKINQLPYAIKAIEEDMAAEAQESRKVRPVEPLYPLIVMSLMAFVVLGTMTFVVPKFAMVLEEMTEGQALPVSTRILMSVSTIVFRDWGWLVWSVFLFIIVVVVPFSITVRCRLRRVDKPQLSSQIGDFIKWYLPIRSWFEKNYSMISVVEMLKLSLNAGSTVNEAISGCLGLDINNRFKRCLRKWLLEVEAGGNIADSARSCGLGNRLAWAFDEKVNQGNTLVVLEMLETLYRSHYSYMVNLARFIMWPCVVVSMGLMVGFVVYAIYIPLVVTINALSATVMP